MGRKVSVGGKREYGTWNELPPLKWRVHESAPVSLVSPPMS